LSFGGVEAVSTCTFTAGLGEDAEKYFAKWTAAVLTKRLPGGGPWEPALHGASLLGLPPAKHCPALGRDGVPGPACPSESGFNAYSGFG